MRFTPNHQCGGMASWDGPCGAPDCYRCHPEFFRRCEYCDRLTYWEDGVCVACGHGDDDE